MANGGRIDYTIGFKLDKSGIEGAKQALQEIQKLTPKDLVKMNPSEFGKGLNEATKTVIKLKDYAKELQQAFTNAFNPITGKTNLVKLSQELNVNTIKNFADECSRIGIEGQRAFYKFSAGALTANTQITKTKSLLDSMGETLANTLKWSLSSSLINRFVGSFQQAYGYVQHLDTSLNDIRIVTGKSADEMNRFAVEANEVAQTLGKATTDYTEAALIYYQQGLSDDEVKARTETTLKASNVTGQSTKEVSEQLTAVWNGYRITAEGTEEAVDKLAAVAATTAADLEELSTGMSKVAAAANSMGVDMDQLNATIATIESVTRQAPESVGTALKTIYARMGDLQLGGADEDDITLGKVSGTLEEVGIHILDVNGDLRDMGTVIEEIGDKWDTWTKAQQTAIAEAVAGKRQYNNLFALFDNWDMYNKALETSRDSTGTLQKQQDIYMESTAAHIQQLKTQWEDFYDSLLDSKTINSFLDGLTKVGALFTKFIDSIGGGKNALVMLGSTLTSVFSKQLGSEIGNIVLRIKDAQEASKQLNAQLQIINMIKDSKGMNFTGTKELVESYEQIKEYYDILDEAGIKQANALAKQVAEAALLKEEFQGISEVANQYVNNTIDSQTKDKMTQSGSYNFINDEEQTKLLQENLNNDYEGISNLSAAYERLQQDADQLINELIELDEEFEKSGSISDSAYENAKIDFDALIGSAGEMEAAINKMSKGFLEANPEIEHLRELLQKVQIPVEDADANELQNYIQQLEEAFNTANPQAQQFLDELAKMQLLGKQAADGVETAKAGMNNFLETEKIKSYSIAWTQLVSSIGQYATAINSLANIGEVFLDDDISAGEKASKVISTIAFTLPMLISSVSTLTKSITTLTGQETLTAAVTTLWDKATKKLVLNNGLLRTSILKIDAALKGMSIVGWGAILTGIAVAITAVVTAVKAYHKELERKAEVSKEDLKIQQEKLDKSKEEKQAVNDLAQSYEELKNQRNEDNKFSLEQEKQVYNLVRAYDDQSMVIQALKKDYEGLESSIRKAQVAANEAQLEEANKTKESAKIALQNTIIAKGGSTEIDKGGFDLSGLGGLNSHDDFRKDLQELINAEEDVIDASGHITYDALIQLLTTDSEALNDFLNKYDDLSATKQLRKLLSDNQEAIKEYKTIEDDIKEATLDKIGYDNVENVENIDSFAAYESILDSLAERAAEAGEEDGRAWAKNFLLAYNEEFSSYDQKDAIVSSISELLEGVGAEVDTDSIISALEGIDESGLSYIAAHINLFASLIKDGKDLQSVLNEVQASLEVVESRDHVAKIDIVLNNDFKNNKDVNEALDSLFADENFDIGLSRSEFNNLSKGDKYFALIQAKQQEINQIQNLTQQEKDEIARQADILDEEISQYTETLDGLIQARKAYVEESQSTMQNILAGAGIDTTNLDIEQVTEEFNQLLAELQDIYKEAEQQGEDGMIAITDKWVEVLEKFENKDIFNRIFEFGINEDDIKNFKKADKSLAQYNEEIQNTQLYLDRLKEESKDVTDATIDYVQAVADIKAGIVELNKDIDSLQSSYQSLQDVVEEYNSTGTLSLDNLQKLLEMDDSYVAALEIENGQMTLNEELMRQMAEAKLQQAKVEATELYINELAAIAKNENVIASQNMYNGDMLSVDGINQVIEAAGRGVEALMQYKNAKDAAAVNFEATKQATQAYYNRMQLIDSVAVQPTSQLLGKADKSSSKSGSSGSAKEPKEEKHLEREEDIFRTINKELEQIESTLGRIQTINDHEWGIDAQKTLEEENKLLDAQLEKLQEKKALHEQDLSIRRKQLEDVGVSFTDDGSAMLNAEAKLNEYYAHYNAMVDTYNAMSAAEQETYKAQLDAEKDRIDKIESKIDDYESAFSDYQSTLDELLDAHYAEIENEIKLFNNMVDVHLELNDAQKEWDDFWYDIVQDVEDTDFGGKIAKSMAKLKTLVGGIDSDVATLTNHLSDTITQVQAQIASANRGGEDSLFGDDTAASKENLENYRDKLMQALTDAKEEVDNISETYLDMLDDAQDKIDKQVDGWESIGDHIEHNVELIKLISGDKAFEPINRLLEQQQKNDLDLINTQKQSQDFWKQQIDRYTKLLETTEEGTVQWKTYSQALEKASENYRKAVSDLDKTVEEALKHLDEWRENQVNSIETALDNAMSGKLGLDLVEQEWKLINDHADRYLDNVERALDMEEYANELDKAANATGLTAVNQEKLNKFRDEELRKLNAKEKLTSYDIEESRARLEILKQQIALEDAQKNKSNMRLRRDNQGNYVYQYTGNDEAEEEAENGGLTARREWYELVKKRYKETSDWILNLEKQQSELLAQIDEAEKNGETERVIKLKEMYQTNEQAIVDAYAEAEKNKRDLYYGTALYFDYVNNAEILPTSETTVRQLIDQWIGGDGKNGFVSSVKEAITQLDTVQENYVTKTKQVLEEAGVAYDTLREDGVDPTTESLERLVETNEELEFVLENVNDQLDEQEKNLRDCEDAYRSLEYAAVEAIQAANAALRALAQTAIQTVQAVQAAVQAAQNATAIANNMARNANTGGGSGGGSGTGTGNKKTTTNNNKYGQKYTLQPDVGGTVGIYQNGKKIEQVTTRGLQGKYNPYDFGVSNWDNLFKYYNLSGLQWYASGGYTGAWGKDGKLAVLHEKELVLNKQDTANILQAVSAIRAITGSNSQLSNAILKSGNVQARMLSQVSSGILSGFDNINTNNSTSNSMVINADFSGVNSADEIYQALLELQNYGLQQNYSVAPHINTPY